MVFNVAFAIAAVAVLVGAAVLRTRRNLVARLRSEWGQALVRDRKLDAIEEHHRARLRHDDASAAIDAQTWSDLHLDEIFANLDRTESTLGQHALYHRLRTEHRFDDLSAFEALIAFFQDNPPARERAQAALARLQELNGYNLWWLAHTDVLATPAWYVMFPCLAFAALLIIVLSPLQFGGFGPLIFLVLAVNVVVGLVTSARLRNTAAAFRQLAPVIATAQLLTFLDRTLHPAAAVIRAETGSLTTLKVLSRLISANWLMLGPDAPFFATIGNDAVNVVYGYLNLAFQLDGNVVYFGARQLRTKSGAVLRLIAAIGEIDVALSVASYRAGSGSWTRPQFVDAATPASLANVRHPLLANPVANSIALAPPRGVLVTGSNMAGKSTFLRTIGAAVVMAQTINTCLADDYRAPFLTVRSFIGRTDDLIAGKSYYLAEVDALLDLVRQSESAAPHLFLLDELFRGTNAVERLAAGEAVLRELIFSARRAKPHIVVAATHDGELVDFLDGVYAPFHFGDSIDADGMSFDYRLRPGPTTSRNAIALLRVQGASAALLECAEARAEKLDASRRGSASTS